MLSAEITGILWILQEQAPHRDDIHVNLGQVRIIKWGSRGRAFYIEGTVPTSQQTWSHWVSTGAQSVNWIVATIKAERKPREKKTIAGNPLFLASYWKNSHGESYSLRTMGSWVQDDRAHPLISTPEVGLHSDVTRAHANLVSICFRARVCGRARPAVSWESWESQTHWNLRWAGSPLWIWVFPSIRNKEIMKYFSGIKF